MQWDNAVQHLAKTIQTKPDDYRLIQAAADSLVQGMDTDSVQRAAVNLLLIEARNLERSFVRVKEQQAVASAPVAQPVFEEVTWSKEQEAELKQRQAAMRSHLNQEVSSLLRRMRMRWSAKLLMASFALRDGRRVTWGEATLSNHKERVEMFKKNAAANLEGAARHQAAIHDITEAGLECLNDLVAEAA